MQPKSHDLPHRKRANALNFDSPPNNSSSFKRLLSRLNCPKTMESGSDSAFLNTRQTSADLSSHNAEENNLLGPKQKLTGMSLLSKMKSFDINASFMMPKTISLSFEEVRKGAFSEETSPFTLKNKLFSEFSESQRGDMDIEHDMSPDLSFKDDIIMVEEAFNREDPSPIHNQFNFSGQMFLNEEENSTKQKSPVVIESLISLEIDNDFQQAKDKSMKQMLDSKKVSSKLNNEFEVLEVIGKGSFGSVHKCKSFADSNFYAVKISNKKMKGVDRDRALNEENVLKMTASFGGENNIVKYHSSWIEDEKMCLLMEYCPTNLKDLSKSTSKFSEQEIVCMLEQLSRGLEFLHSHNIVHMDVKPENILIDQNNNLKLADFGQSRIISPVFKGDFDDGDSKYLAPELLNLSSAETNGTQLKAADIFSLGITLYEILTKSELPSRGEGWKALRNGEFSLLDQISEISISLKHLMKRMIDPNPKNRPSPSEILQHEELRCNKKFRDCKKISI